MHIYAHTRTSGKGRTMKVRVTPSLVANFSAPSTPGGSESIHSRMLCVKGVFVLCGEGMGGYIMYIKKILFF